MVSLVLAILSMFLVHPDRKYISYIDWHSITLLFCLMAVMAGFKETGLFRTIGNALLAHVHTTRQLFLVLVLLPFVFSMFITNDVSLITFVPFAIIVLSMSEKEHLIIPVVVTLLKDDRRAFIRYAAFIIAGFSISLTICMIWPNCQLLRPSVVDTSTLCGWLVNAIYSADTPTNVLPSMHVVGCMAVLAVTFDSKYLKKVRIPAVIIAAAICAATVFVKQHSILDVFAALALSLVLYLIIYVAARRIVDRRQPTATA